MSVVSFVSYLSLEKKYSSHTVKAYEKDIEDFKEFCLMEYELEAIETVDYPIIRNWIVSLVNSKISNRSVNRKVASLKAYYKFLLKAEQIEINPLAKHKALKVAKKVEVPFSEAEMYQMLEQIPFEEGFEGIRDKLVIELLYTTGIRRSELINLRLGDIDLNTKTIRVIGKRNKERIVPLLTGTIELF